MTLEWQLTSLLFVEQVINFPLYKLLSRSNKMSHLRSLAQSLDRDCLFCFSSTESHTVSAYIHLFTNAQNQARFTHTYGILFLCLRYLSFMTEIIRSPFPRCNCTENFCVLSTSLDCISYAIADTKRQGYSSKIDSLLATGHWPHLNSKERLGIHANRINDRTRTIWPWSSLKTTSFPFYSGMTLVSYHNVMNYSYKKMRRLFTICHG